MALFGMPAFTLEEVRSRTYKPRDAWWTVFLVDPLAGRLVVVLANRTSVTPNQVTWGAFALGLGSAACFLMAGWEWLLAGAVLYHLSFVLDCVDGKIARLKGTGTVMGGWLDYVFDRIRVLACALALTWGRFEATGEESYLLLGVLIVFLDMLRYVDALQVAKVRRQMRRRLIEAIEEVTGVPAATGAEHPAADGVPSADAVDLQQNFRARFAWYIRVRDWLRDHRVRAHLVSGIEFQMAVFVVGPLTGAVAPVTLGAAALLLVFEAAIMFKLWLSSRDFTRELARIRSAAPRAGSAPSRGGHASCM
ncbi:CDP-alcohol phosphatidyltransferase family protein [Nonomuraea indica]|uniref:CDP-alcohol phosphatidyltransferase family protein n=1 Tax=Nonomuraea indica TaxID=1581193 RepID=A0ABW8A732_9ACTN